MISTLKPFISAFVLGAMCIPSFAAESTIAQTVSELRYDGQGDVSYLIGAGSWGVPSCPNAVYVQVLSTVPGRKQLLAIALAAQASNTKIALVGTCDVDPLYFNAKYIIVKQ